MYPIHRRTAITCMLGMLAFSGSAPACAGEAQSLRATIGTETFVSDDDSILLVPVKNTFTLSAATAGASAYPPPKTPIDRLSIMCKDWNGGKPQVIAAAALNGGECNVTFTRGSAPGTEYRLDGSATDNQIAITASHDKVIEGKFQLRLKDKAGNALSLRDGAFRAEDRQMN